MPRDNSLAVKQHTLTEVEEKRTIWIMGKPYHWELVDNLLTMKPGMTDHEQIRTDVMQKLIAKGVKPFDITVDMIEEVIAKAESAAIQHALKEDADAPKEP